MRGRKKTFPAIARLSRAAREIMERAFLQGPGVRSVKSVIEEIHKQTGEKIDDNAVYRYREYWLSEERPFIEGRKQADSMLSALKDNPGADMEELVRQRLTLAQVLTAKNLDHADPVELGWLATQVKRFEIEQEKVNVSKERLSVMRERLKQLERALQLKEKQIEAAKQKADKAAGKIDEIGKRKGLDAETLKKIREEVYGIVEAPV